jgi:hypothetical protein
MQFDEIDQLRRHSQAWRLLRADNAALVLGFLGRIFVEENVRAITEAELVERLEDELVVLNEQCGEGAFPRRAKAYLDDWSAPDTGYLRRYYPSGSDEVHFDATPVVEKALSWVKGLRQRSFVGTESRLNTIFELLRQMVYGTESDPRVRLAELHRRRQEIDDEIAAVTAGRMPVLDPSAQRDRYQQFAATATELLADFREVEANFRALDRELRARIAAWEGSKGELLDEVLGSRTSIADSDQGRSFQAFYDFLLSHDKQVEFTELLDHVHALEALGEPDPRMRRVHHAWLDAAERTQMTVRLLSEQLRRFLDDQVWLENRRVIELLRGIEAGALTLREVREPDLTCEIDGTAPAVSLPMERPLYTPPDRAPLRSDGVAAADEVLDSSQLFEQVFVDPQRLCDGVRGALGGRTQIGLGDVIDRMPLRQGLAELVTYLSLSDPSFEVVFDETVREQITWRDAGADRTATVPRVTFTRRGVAA